MTIAYPIAHAWLSTGGTGAQNYDEFADDAEITEIIAANPASALAVEMPHRAPESLGRSFTDSLPAAAQRLAQAKAEGRYAAHEDVAVLYRITEPDGAAGYGVWAMVDTDQISTSADEPGLVIRNEDVFLEKVRERVALAQATGHLLSPVLLLQTGRGDDLQAALAAAVAAAGAPAVSDTDQAGRVHEVWPLPVGPAQEEILGLAGGGELVVADGNHRSLAAQTAGLPRFLAVITTPASVAIQPYNRLVSSVGFVDGVDGFGFVDGVDGVGLVDGVDGVGGADVIEGLRAAGAVVTPLPAVAAPAGRGQITGYGPGGAFAVELPRAEELPEVENLDHALVERILLGRVLGLEPGDKRITYVGGDYPASWLVGEVDAGRAELAVLIAPVTVPDFVAVNLARQKLPRKSTWFTPKARAGLVVAEIAGTGV